MKKHWCVNFESVDGLHHGIRNKLWLMGYQYQKKGADTPARKAAITRNWKRLEEITVGDKFVAYLPGNKLFATATVITPRRQKTSGDRTDTVSDYLKRGKAYSRGHVYFSPSVAYENFTDECDGYPVRIDVDKWEDFVPDGVSVKGPTVPRYKTVYAAFDIDKDRFDAIRSVLSGELVKKVIPEEVDPSATYVEGAAKIITVNAYERSRKARAKCIEHHGWACGVCGYDMAELYGTVGEGMIHVHHLRELAALGEEYEVDPIEDLRPVCPNCHAILHTSSPAMTIKHLRKVLSVRKPIRWPGK
ncbi:hypothetical protein BH11PLA2_BH11PLA2_16370 [soil metagenome]